MLAVGTSTDGANASSDALATELTAGGDEVWTQAYGGAGADHAMDADPTAVGGLRWVADAASSGADDPDLFVVETDATGQVDPPPA